jgi:2-oxo-3-hexenedioate decarboxylase
VDVTALAQELKTAREQKRVLSAPLSTREPDFDLETGYAVGAELARMRRADGHTIVGRKVGYANRAVWRALKLETLVWGPMYDDTVIYARDNSATLSVARMCMPKIEPEVVFKLRHSPEPAAKDPDAVLQGVEWLALGFEIADTVFTDWKFQPADFVAAYAHHAALVVGSPRTVDARSIPSLVDALASCPVRLSRNGELIAEGSGRNILKSPALCLAELASAIARRAGEVALASGDLVSTGSMTEPQPIGTGETWTVNVGTLGLADLTLRTTG